MTRYKISWEESTWYDLEIEAESQLEAEEIFSQSAYNPDDVKIAGQEWVQDSVAIEEV